MFQVLNDVLAKIIVSKKEIMVNSNLLTNMDMLSYKSMHLWRIREPNGHKTNFTFMLYGFMIHNFIIISIKEVITF